MGMLFFFHPLTILFYTLLNIVGVGGEGLVCLVSFDFGFCEEGEFFRSWGTSLM